MAAPACAPADAAADAAALASAPQGRESLEALRGRRGPLLALRASAPPK